MKNTVLLIVFTLLLGSCSSNNDPLYRILRIKNDRLLEVSNKMLKKKYVLRHYLGNTTDNTCVIFLYQKFSNIVYLPQNEFYKDNVDLKEVTQYITAPIIKSSDTITTSAIFNNINKTDPNLLVRRTWNDINMYIPVYSPVFYQEILQIIQIMINIEINHDFSRYYLKKIPVNEYRKFNIKKLENVLNDIYIKENLLFSRVLEGNLVFIGEE